jgi:hypothetical protein
MPGAIALPRVRTHRIWSEQWESAQDRLLIIEAMLRQRPLPIRRGGEYDDWDLEVRGGLFACVRARLGVEEYPQGHQHLRFRAWPNLGAASYLVAVSCGLAATAALQKSPVAALLLGTFAALLLLRALGDYGAAVACLRGVLDRYGEKLQGRAAEAAWEADAPVASEQQTYPPGHDFSVPRRGESAVAPPPDERADLATRLARTDLLDLPTCGVRDKYAERTG